MKRNPAFLPAVIFIFVAACFFTFQITYHKTDRMWRENVDNMLRTEATRVGDDLSALQEAVSNSFYYSTDENNTVDGIMNGYISGLNDRFAMYLNSKQYADYIKTSTASTSVGIGVNLLYDSSLDGLYVVNVYPDSPAKDAGIVPGDIITHINGTLVDFYGFYGSVLELGHGNENDKIAVSVRKKNGESVSSFINKRVVTAQNISFEKLGNSIGLISISGFDADAKTQFVEAMESLIASGCEKFVIDIRNNHGGNLAGVTGILDFLLPSGPLVTVTDKAGTTNTIDSDVNESHYPVAVLINRGTICEAEVFAAAMKNLGKAKLIGSTTYGKASKQTMFTLPDGAAACFSTSVYSPSDGVSFDGMGINPDIIVNLPDSIMMNFTSIDKSEDTQLQEAVNYLKEQKVENIIY